MPFTPAHIVAILPFHRAVSPQIFIALCIGAITPDLSLLFPIASYNFAHSLMGTFGFSLPYGMVLFLIMKYAGLDFARYAYFRMLFDTIPNKIDTNINQWSSVCVSIVFGAMTHVLWDSFTHLNGWGVSNFEVLKQNVYLLFLHLPVFKLLQYGSSILGMFIIGWISLNKTLSINKTIALNINYRMISYLIIFTITPILIFSIIGTINEYDFKYLIGFVIKKTLATLVSAFYSFIYSI